MKKGVLLIAAIIFVLIVIILINPQKFLTGNIISSSLGSREDLEERLGESYSRLHEPDSANLVRDNFPDLELVYTDNPTDSEFFPSQILPFRYYYSKEADKTFSLCATNRSVFICNGKLDRLIAKEDLDSGRCIVTQIYTNDLRIGGSGKLEKN